MNEQELMDVESAYGSENGSNPDCLLKRDTFTIEEPRRQTHYQWIKYKLREYMILEAVVLIQLLILVFLLITCTRNTSQNQETQRMISGIKSELNSLQKLMIGKNFMNMTQENKKVDEKELKKAKEVQMKPAVKTVPSQSISNSTTILTRAPTSVPTVSTTPTIKRFNAATPQAVTPTINSTTTSKKTHVPKTVPTVPTKSTLEVNLPKRTEKLMAPSKRFNAASLFAGATIDKDVSSSSSLNPFIGFDQSSLVLVDRSEPPSSKAWCTFDKNPVLTVSLGRYINPTVVSYQHSKWNGTIPDGAPKEYSVVACPDNYCIKQKPLFSHCEYNQHGLQEQICNKVSKDSITSPVAKLQFIFHKNHGNTERTCVSLVRVYSKTAVIEERKMRRLEETTSCIDLTHRYHHNTIMYKFFSYKTCAVLYSKECCQECPECCEECILLVLVQFYIKRKFSKLELKQPESDKLYLIFGYSGIVFLTSFAHFYAWCLDYNSKVGFTVLAVYHALIAIHAHLFIIKRARKYTYHYSNREELYQWTSVIFSSLLIFFFLGNVNSLFGSLVASHFFATYFVELRVVLSWRVSIEEVKYTPEYYRRRAEYYRRIGKIKTFESVVVRL